MLALMLVVVRSPAAVAQRPTTPNRSVSDLERGVRERVNNERIARKLNALGVDVRLSQIARAHSEDMARRHFFSHVNPDGDDPTVRGKRAGYECHKEFGRVIREGIAENLYEATASPAIVAQSVRGWMGSPGHRKNILEKGYDRTGVGIAISGGRIFITQLFC